MQKFTLRLPTHLHELIRQEAFMIRISMNQLMEKVLTDYFKRKGELK